MVVVDDFYNDPDEIRRIALSTPFFQYRPPTEDQVGAKASRFADLQPSWFSTALVRNMGEDVHKPEMGFRDNPPELHRRFEDLLNESVALVTGEVCDVHGARHAGAASTLGAAVDHGLDIIR